MIVGNTKVMALAAGDFRMQHKGRNLFPANSRRGGQFFFFGRCFFLRRCSQINDDRTQFDRLLLLWRFLLRKQPPHCVDILNSADGKAHAFLKGQIP